MVPGRWRKGPDVRESVVWFYGVCLQATEGGSKASNPVQETRSVWPELTLDSHFDISSSALLNKTSGSSYPVLIYNYMTILVIRILCL